MSGWLVEWYFDQVLADRERRTQDAGVPAYPWLADGTPVEVPVSFVAAATQKRYSVLINLDELRRSTHLALKGTPDTRTPQQKSRDAWREFQAAKEKYERRTCPRCGRGRSKSAGCPDRCPAAADGPPEGPQDRPAARQEQEAQPAPEGPATASGGIPEHRGQEGADEPR